MGEFEALVRIIRQRIAFGQSMPEIHDALDDGHAHFEENFFFAWRAAEILGVYAG